MAAVDALRSSSTLATKIVAKDNDHFLRPGAIASNNPLFSTMVVPEQSFKQEMETADALFRDTPVSGERKREGKREPKIRRAGSKSVILSAAETDMALNKILNILSLRGGGIPADATKITDYMYLGNMKNAMNVEEMRGLGITHVLNMAALETGLHPKYDKVVPDSFVYKEVQADDSADYDIAKHLQEAETFISKAKAEGGVVLVHCYAGINRSGFIVAAHLLLKGCSVMNIVRRLKTDRGSFLSNTSFQEALLGLALHRNLLV